MYNIYIYAGKERVGLLQNESSVQWQEHYAEPGEVKLVVAATPENVATLVKGNRLYNTDFDTVARIEQVETDGRGDGGTLVVRARTTSALLEERVVIGARNITNIELGMYTVYSANRRGLPIETAYPMGYPQTLQTQVQWGSVLEAEKQLAKAAGFGFRVVFNPTTCTEFLMVYEGTNRTAGASYVGYFGFGPGNLARLQMKDGTAGFKNVAVVQGGSDGVVVTASLANVAGEARREMYVDATSVQKDYRVAQDTGSLDYNGNPIYTYTTESYSDAVYRSILESAGLEALLKQPEVREISAEVTQQPIAFGKDFFLGDILPLKAESYGLALSARVLSVKKVYEASGIRTVIGLGEFA